VIGLEDLKKSANERVMYLYSGQAACLHLSDSGAIPMLLKVLTDHGSSLSPVTELAVKALVKFVDDLNGKKAFLNGGGIKSLVSVLKLDAKSSDVKSITTIILVSYSSPLDARVGIQRLPFLCFPVHWPLNLLALD